MAVPSIDQIVQACMLMETDKQRARAKLRGMWAATKRDMYANRFFFGIKLFTKRITPSQGLAFIFCGMHVDGRDIKTVWVAQPHSDASIERRIVVVPFYSFDAQATFRVINDLRRSIKYLQGFRSKQAKYELNQLTEQGKAMPAYARRYRERDMLALCFS